MSAAERRRKRMRARRDMRDRVMAARFAPVLARLVKVGK